MAATAHSLEVLTDEQSTEIIDTTVAEITDSHTETAPPEEVDVATPDTQDLLAEYEEEKNWLLNQSALLQKENAKLNENLNSLENETQDLNAELSDLERQLANASPKIETRVVYNFTNGTVGPSLGCLLYTSPSPRDRG